MKKEYSLLKEIKKLKSIRGQGTQLISVYIPSGMQISDEVSKLREESGQSSNIKSKTTRTNVLSAIDKIMQYLKLYRETPKGGLAIFCGNISDVPGRESIELFSIEPPLPLKVNIYRCDSTFLLDPLEDMIAAKDVFALLVMDGREATIATLKGPQIQIIKRLNSTAHAKIRKGGQSAGRFERLIEESIEFYYKRIGDSVNDLFARSGFKIKGLIIGGPGPAKEGFAKSNTVNYQVKVLGMYDTGYTDEFGLHELVEKASDLLREQEAAQERGVIEKFMREVAHGGLAVYGYDDTLKALLANQVSRLIINRDLNLRKEIRRNEGGEITIVYEGEKDKKTNMMNEGKMHSVVITEGMPASSVNQWINSIKSDHSPSAQISGYNNLALAYPTLVEQRDAIEELIEIADQKGIEISFVSSESSYGKEFLMGFRGIGALLRYK